MRIKHPGFLVAIIGLSGVGCASRYLTKPSLSGQKLVSATPEQNSTDREQGALRLRPVPLKSNENGAGPASIASVGSGAGNGQQTMIKPMSGEKRLDQVIEAPLSGIQRPFAAPRIIPLSEGSDVVVIKSGREGDEAFAIGVQTGNGVVVLAVVDPYAGFFLEAGSVIFIGGIYGGPTVLPAVTVEDHFVSNEEN
jgi:hypothetical protein